MVKKILFLWVILVWANVFSQRDSIFIDAKLSQNNSLLSVNQKIILKNNFDKPLTKIKLLNWVSSYKNKNTKLAKRKIEDRKSDLYFASQNQLGKLLNLKINNRDFTESLDAENLYLNLQKPLNSGENLEINLAYDLKLPDQIFTGFGTSQSKTFLKYFFIVPDGFEDENQSPKDFLDIGETQFGGAFWKINLKSDQQVFLTSNLKQTSKNSFEGILSEDPEISVNNFDYQQLNTKVDEQNIVVDFDYDLKQNERENLEFYLPLQLKFLKERIGFLPDKIFLSERFKNKEDFFGNDDIKFWKFRYQLFTEQENTDLDYFSILSKKVVEQSFINDKNSEHWFKNGLKTYLEIEYLKKFYPNHKLLGNLPEQANIFGLKPLKWFNASKMKLSERYGIAYQYIMTQNLDQKIGENYEALSNLNQMIISNFETGSLFNFIGEKMGTANFDGFLQNYLSTKQNQRVNPKDFLDKLAIASKYSSEFLENYFQHKNRVNFNLKKFKNSDDNYEVKIYKNTDKQIPFKIQTTQKSEDVSTIWYDTKNEKGITEYSIPQNDAEKITLNGNYAFPESNFRDNYLYTKGFFTNMKRLKLKLIKDIPNPEYNEIYLNPRMNFNAYDKVLIGLNFRNTALFDQKFNYSLTPYYSTGTGKLTGSGSVAYSFQPAESFYRNLTLGVSGSYFHYDYDLTYRKFSAFSSINFNKNPRSTESRSLGISWNHFEKDISPQMILDNEYDKYNLWNIGFGYSDSKLIHEKYVGSNVQLMEDFAKISAEAFYRWEFAQNKKISFRFFGGYFFNNRTRNNLFDYGISKVSNYSFSYGLLGQSATSGILNQQFILADGGFKTFFKNTANQWITSVNVDSHVWKIFNIYADAGVYKNQNSGSKFIWDSGIKLKVIPDFLEIYFPVQSSLGFEPAFKDYGYRIRYTLNLNLNAAVNYFRRGWF